MNYVGNEPAPAGLILVGDTNPVGSIFWRHSVPDGSYLQANGQTVSKTTYPDLWSYAQGFLTADQVANPGLYKDASGTTFALPKLDGLFIRAQGTLDANHVSAALGVKQADDNLAHTHQPVGGAQFIVNQGVSLAGLTGGAQLHTVNLANSGGTEARPANVALVPCVKALRTVLMPSASLPTFTARVKVVSFTRDISLASGSQAVTGVGFKAGAAIFMGALPAASVSAGAVGVDDGTTAGAVINTGAAVAAGNWGTTTAFSINISTSGANNAVAKISSFDDDGFTLAWTKTGTPTGVYTFNALLIR